MPFDASGTSLANRVYFGRVVHTRVKPFRHALDYRVFSILVDIDEIDQLDKNSKFFCYNRFGLLSFYDKDHGERDGSALRPWVEHLLKKRDVDTQGGPIQVLCFPRILGYVFNPLTIYYCRKPSGALAAIVYEVKNTFGEQHSYVLPVTTSKNERFDQQVDKVFHVSPFMEVVGRYSFRLTEPGEKLGVNIRYKDDQGEDLLIASHTGRGSLFGDAALMKALIKHPGQMLKVIGGIHWEALKLVIKGAVFHSKPAPPQKEASW